MTCLRALARRRPTLRSARELSRLDKTLRSARIDAVPEAERPALSSLSEALADGLPGFAPERLELFGLHAPTRALTKHFGMLSGMLKKLLDILDKTELSTLRAVIDGGRHGETPTAVASGRGAVRAAAAAAWSAPCRAT